jgi:hypothetical protein
LDAHRFRIHHGGLGAAACMTQQGRQASTMVRKAIRLTEISFRLGRGKGAETGPRAWMRGATERAQRSGPRLRCRRDRRPRQQCALQGTPASGSFVSVSSNSERIIQAKLHLPHVTPAPKCRFARAIRIRLAISFLSPIPFGLPRKP